MVDLLKTIRLSPLFFQMTGEDIRSVLGCLRAQTKTFDKNQILFRYGDSMKNIGLVLSGQLHIYQNDFFGNRGILSVVESGQLFGESYACSDGAPLTADIVATMPTTVLFLSVDRVISACPSHCSYHVQLIRNLLTIVAEKSLELTGKLHHVAQRSIRDKLLSYLTEESRKHQSLDFEIPFNRQELADFLSVDRSAMSKELSKMREDGLLSYRKNRFCLVKRNDDLRG